MTRVKVFVFVAMTALLCGLVFSRSADADSYATEEKAIHEACPQRVVFGSGIPAGYRYADMRADSSRMTRCTSVAEGKAVVAEEKALHEACPQRAAFGSGIPAGYRYADMRVDSSRMTRCTSVAEGKAVVAEEKALHEACPQRVAFGRGIPAGYRYDTQSGGITRCTSAAEGKAVVAEKKTLQEDDKLARSANVPVHSGGEQPRQSTQPTYQDVLTPQEIAWSNSLLYVHRATTQFSPAQIAQIKQDGRWEPWVAQTKTEVARQNKSVSASQKPIETHPSPMPHRESAPVLTSRALQTRIDVSERIIEDLQYGGMQQAASEKLAQAKRELQAGKLETSQALLHEANKYAALASQRARDNIDDELPPIAKLPVIDRPVIGTEEWQNKLPRYGNFGGKGYTGGYDENQMPINRMDEIFQKHDNDYRAAKNQDAILLADKDLVAGLKKIDKNNILILKGGNKGKLYGTLEDDITYRNKAIKLFSLKIFGQEYSEAGAAAGGGGVGAR